MAAIFCCCSSFAFFFFDIFYFYYYLRELRSGAVQGSAGATWQVISLHNLWDFQLICWHYFLILLRRFIESQDYAPKWLFNYVASSRAGRNNCWKTILTWTIKTCWSCFYEHKISLDEAKGLLTQIHSAPWIYNCIYRNSCILNSSWLPAFFQPVSPWHNQLRAWTFIYPTTLHNHMQVLYQPECQSAKPSPQVFICKFLIDLNRVPKMRAAHLTPRLCEPCKCLL